MMVTFEQVDRLVNSVVYGAIACTFIYSVGQVLSAFFSN